MAKGKPVDNTLLVRKLQSVIDEKLKPLIDNDYVLWDLPYHKNIGDTLIWQGTLDFLSNTKYKLKDFGSRETASFKKVDKDTIVCLQGGGNWGDIYRSSQEFRNKVIQTFSENKIIVFPQSIYYKNHEVLLEDAEKISSHKNLYICVRDRTSYDLARKYFLSARIVLVPDMAFYMQGFINSVQNNPLDKKNLFLRRKDVELLNISYKELIDDVSFDTTDWPTFEKNYCSSIIIRVLVKVAKKNNIVAFNSFLSYIVNKYALLVYKPFLLKEGVCFLNKYNNIYTTRLHVGILSILLNKKVCFLDNSYGKLGSFYKEWLSNEENITYKLP